MREVLAIYKKEMQDYFYSSIAYVFLILFIFTPYFFLFHFFNFIFKENMASMRLYFMILPYVFAIFIPGLTMGSWAKERSSGTIELILTLPVTQIQVLLGKFLAALSLVVIALLSTLFGPLLIQLTLGSFDWYQIIAQYIGAIIMATTFIAVTFFISSFTKELIVAFLISVVLLLFLTVVGYFGQTINLDEVKEAFSSMNIDWLGNFATFLLKGIKEFFNLISLSTHFQRFSMGVIDSRDLLYYLGLTGIFFYLNLRTLESKRWS